MSDRFPTPYNAVTAESCDDPSPDDAIHHAGHVELPGPAHGEPQAVVTLAPADGPTPPRRPTLADLHDEIEHRKDRLIHFGDKLSEGERALIRRELDRMEPAFREVVRAYGQVWRTHGRCCQVFTYEPTRNAVNSVVAFAMDSLKAPEGAMP